MNNNPPPFGGGVLVGTERFSYPYKECLVPLSNRCEISQSTSLVRRGFHKKCLVPISNRCGISQSTLMAQRDFYTLVRNVWFSSPTNVGSHTPPPSAPSVLADIEEFPHPYKQCMVPLPNRCGISQSTPSGAQHPRWHTARCVSDTIRNSPNPQLTDIFCFNLLRITVSLMILKRVC